MSNSDVKEGQVEATLEGKAGRTALGLIFLTVFIDLIGFGMAIPVLPTYAKELNADATMIGWLLASYSIMQFIFTPIWGRLSDRVGRKPILIASLIASCIGYLIWGFSNSLVLLFVSRIVAGFGNANVSVAQAYIADITTKENRTKGMGMIGAAFGLGFVLGPVVGGFCVGHGLAALGFVAFAFSFIDLVLTAILLPEPKKRSNAGTDRFRVDPGFYMRVLTSERLRSSMAIFFISTFAFANMETTLVLLTKDQYNYDAKMNLYMFIYIGILIVLVQGGLVRRLSKKYSDRSLIAVGTMLLAIGLALTPTGNQTVLWVALAFLAFGSGINTPANQGMISKLASEDEVGGVLGVGQSISTLGRILGPIVGGMAFQQIGLATPYVIGCVAMLVAFGLTFSLPKMGKIESPATAN